MRTSGVHVVVLGAGIRGSLLASLLSNAPDLRITLVERAWPGAGTTSTNHGRLHCGTWNFPYADPAETRYAVAAGRMMRNAFGAPAVQERGFYCIEQSTTERSFLDFCAEYDISIDKVSPTQTSRGFPGGDYAAVYRIPEYSFNPAAVAAAGVSVALTSGRCQIRFGTVHHLTMNGGHFRVELANGEIITADFVINTLGRWARAVTYDIPTPFPDVNYLRWRLMAVDHSRLPGWPAATAAPASPALPVVTVHGRERSIAAVPQGQWTIFGCDPPGDVLEGKDRFEQDRELTRFRRDNSVDNFLYEAHVAYFPELAEAAEVPDALWTFAGVSVELTGDSTAPYPVGELLSHPDCRQHFITFGGSATTALADMRRAADAILAELGVSDGLPSGQVSLTIQNVATQAGFRHGMVWEVARDRRFALPVPSDASDIEWDE